MGHFGHVLIEKARERKLHEFYHMQCEFENFFSYCIVPDLTFQSQFVGVFMGVLHSETNLLPNFQNYFNSLRGHIECLFGCLLNEKARERKPHEFC